jgi:branched-chain amino acid transport system permease protein
MHRKGTSWLINLAVIGAILLLPLFLAHPYVLHVAILAMLNIMWASSLRFIALTGQFSLAHGGMIAIGAYTSALLTIRAGLSFWCALPVAAFFCAVVGLGIGYAFSRLKGMYFTMVTLFFTEFVRLMAEQWRGLTGGVAGLYNVPRPDPISIFGLLNLAFTSRVHFYYLAFALALIAFLFFYTLERSPLGVLMLSTRQNEALAESTGVNTTWLKVMMFSAGCLFAGIGGAFYGHYLSAFYPKSFGVLLSISIFIYAATGGFRNILGPIVGATVLTIIPETVSRLKEYSPLVFGGVVLLVVFFLREGLTALPSKLLKGSLRRTLCS